MVILGWINPELNPRKNGAGRGIGLALLFVTIRRKAGVELVRLRRLTLNPNDERRIANDENKEAFAWLKETGCPGC
jgi:hypothetical protein